MHDDAQVMATKGDLIRIKTHAEEKFTLRAGFSPATCFWYEHQRLCRMLVVSDIHQLLSSSCLLRMNSGSHTSKGGPGYGSYQSTEIR